MQFNVQKKQTGNLYLAYTACFLVFLACYFGVIFATNHTPIWQLDGAQQHIQILQQFHHDVWMWLKHPSHPLPQWSWRLGIGGDLFSVNVYYCLGDIFAYLALLVPTSLVGSCYYFSIGLRFYLVGLAFCYFASHFKLSRVAILAGSLAYLGSNYLFFCAVAQPFFLTPLIQFPLLITAANRFFTNGNWQRLLVIWSWIFISNFYFAYMLGVGFFIYLFILQSVTFTSLKDTLIRVLAIIKIIIVAGFISAVILLPEVLALHNSTRGADKIFASGIFVYPFWYYLHLPAQFLGITTGLNSMDYWSMQGFLPICLISVVMIILSHRQYPILARLVVLGGIFLLFPWIAAIFNGFSSPANRWVFMLQLPIALCVCFFVNHYRMAFNQKILKITTAILIVQIISSIATAIFARNAPTISGTFSFFLTVLPEIVAGGWLIILALLCRFSINQTAANVIICGGILLNLCGNAVLYLAPNYGNFVVQMLKQNALSQNTTAAYVNLDRSLKVNIHSRISTQAYGYTVANNQRLYNNLSNPHPAIFAYYSIFFNSLQKFSTAYGNVQYTPNLPIQEVDNRPILQNYLGVTNLFAKNNSKQIGANYHLKATTNFNHKKYYRYSTTENFPILWWTNHYQSQKNNLKLSYPAREYMLSQAVVLPDTTDSHGLINTSLPKNTVTLVKPKSTTITYTANSSQRLTTTVKLTSKLRHRQLIATITNLSFLPITKTSAKTPTARQLILQNTQQKPGYSVTIISNKISPTLAQYGTNSLSQYHLVNSAALNLGYFKTSLPSSLKLKFSSLGTYQFKLNIYAVNLGTSYKKAVKQIKQNGLKNIKFGTNTVTASLSHSTTGIVTSSIPYANGWHAYVDGKQVATIETNYGMLGFKVPAGSHKITLKYTTPGLKIGLIISLITLIATIGGSIWVARKKKTN